MCFSLLYAHDQHRDTQNQVSDVREPTKGVQFLRGVYNYGEYFYILMKREGP